MTKYVCTREIVKSVYLCHYVLDVERCVIDSTSETLFKKQKESGFLSSLKDAILQILRKRTNRFMYLYYYSLKFYSSESRESKFNNTASTINIAHKIISS